MSPNEVIKKTFYRAFEDRHRGSRELIKERLKNYRVEDVPGTIDRVLAHFAPLNPVIDRTDGVSVEFDDWRFNLRGSNTEPLLRLNVETRSDLLLLEKYVSTFEKLIGYRC